MSPLSAGRRVGSASRAIPCRRYHGQALDAHISAGLCTDGREEPTWGRDEDSGDPARSGELMSSSVTAVRPRRDLPSLADAPVSEQRIRRRVGIAYSLLFFNALTFYPGTVVPAYPVGRRQGPGAGRPAAGPARGADGKSQDHHPPERIPLPGIAARAGSADNHPAAAALRHGLPDLPAGRIRGRALAADPVVGQARSAAGPMSPQGARGAPRLGAPRLADVTSPRAS